MAQVAASVLGIRDRAGQPVLETLVAALSTRHVLLVLDNCEHLSEGCAAMADALLSSCPDVQVLATSREPLRVTGEVVWRVGPLATPAARSPISLEELSSFAAVGLFLGRARAARSDFTLTEQNASAVSQICALAEGLPLALELAGARVRVLGVEQIKEQLRNSLGLLSADTRAAPHRHRTIEATLDWSFKLPSDPERTLFQRLSVLAGSWTLEAAEAVGDGGEIGQRRVLDLLTQLVDKSLVVMEDQQGLARYRFLEPIRQYARAYLVASGELDATRRRHARHFLELGEQLASGSPGLHTWAMDERRRGRALGYGAGPGRIWSAAHRRGRPCRSAGRVPPEPRLQP